MKIPVWIGTPVVLALATTDAALVLQSRAVGALTRAVMRRMFIATPGEGSCPSDKTDDIFRSA
ncbi:hypothetical protein [Rhodococcus sp. UNC363MFTsu5.1]|uniref:hypothetical protein n=1 Tax=Rhodococcus sp. UNC363MFTsu5.1 TaxID=1449069 RepID=UPI000488677E|nr:hypothetical protein [Rhodococcus sp. UNC363MFTsu5.1]